MEQQLKQRLVGAVVLVSLAVIFIPIILEGPGDEWTPRSHTIPEPPPMDFRTTMELPMPGAADESGHEPDAVSAGPAESAMAQDDSSDAPPAPAPVIRESVPAPAPAELEKPAVTALAAGWYAQVGSFSQQANAGGLRDRLSKAGYSAYLQQTDTGTGRSYRVLAGPEKGRDSAEKLLQKIARQLQLKGIVIEISAPPG